MTTLYAGMLKIKVPQGGVKGSAFAKTQKELSLGLSPLVPAPRSSRRPIGEDR